MTLMRDFLGKEFFSPAGTPGARGGARGGPRRSAPLGFDDVIDLRDDTDRPDTPSPQVSDMDTDDEQADYNRGCM